MSARKDLLADIVTDNAVTITTSTGRSYTAPVREHTVRDLELGPPVERLELLLGRIELVEAAPAEADIRPSGGGRAAM